MRQFACLLIVLGIAINPGCEKQPTLAEVTGRITVDGQPVPTGTITFYPDTSKGNTSMHRPTGIVAANGQYELYLPGGVKGVPLGWYQIVVYAVDHPQPGRPNQYFTNKIYTDITTTPLEIEVIPKPELGRYDLKLKKPS